METALESNDGPFGAIHTIRIMDTRCFDVQRVLLVIRESKVERVLVFEYRVVRGGRDIGDI